MSPKLPRNLIISSIHPSTPMRINTSFTLGCSSAALGRQVIILLAEALAENDIRYLGTYEQFARYSLVNSLPWRLCIALT